jgi:hypothetical protein
MAGDQPKSKPSHRWSRLWSMVISTLRDYVVSVRWSGEQKGITAVRNLIRSGPLYWPGIVVLSFAVIAAAYLSLQGQRFAPVSSVYVEETVQVPWPALYLSLMVAAFGWAYLLVGALAAGLGVYCLVTAYVTYCGLTLASGSASLAWRSAAVLIPIWLLALAGWGALARRTRWRPILLLLLSLLAAVHSYAGLRLQTLVPLPWGLLLIAGIYFALAANGWVTSRRPIQPVLAFVVSLLLFGLLYAATLRSIPAAQFMPYVVFVFQYLLYLLEIFWFWMGAQLIDTGRTLAEWTLARIEATIPRRVLAPALGALSMGWNIVLTLLTYAYQLEGSVPAASVGWRGAVLQAYLHLKPSLALVSANQYHSVLNAAMFVYVGVLIAKRRYSHEKLLQLVGISLLVFFILYGYLGAFYSLSGATEVLAGLQPLLLFIVLMLWETIKAASDLAAGSGNRAGLLLGCLLIVASISMFELAAHSSHYALTLTVTPFLGALYLGLPYLLYTVLYQQRRYAPAPAEQVRTVFLLGMISAIPSLVAGRVFFAPCVWLLITLVTVWRWGRWDHLWDGLTYLLALGLGFAVYYTYPLFVPIPILARFLNQLVLFELSYTAQNIPPWDPRWWQVFVGVLGAAAILGYVLWQARQSKGRRQVALAILGVLLSVAWLALGEYVQAL